jgi:regulator of protease activity HflC (stomatin/prohibitin superfamily)
MFKMIGAGVATLFALIMLYSGIYAVDQTERGVLLSGGRITGIETAGWGWKNPVTQSLVRISVADRLIRYEKLEGYSHDQQAAHYMVSVQYKIDPSKVDEVYNRFSGEEGVVARLITPAVFRLSKVVIGQFTAQDAIRDRARLNTEILSKVQEDVKGPLMILGVNVEDIKFSANYEQSIEQRMLAEVAVEKEKQNRDRERVLAEITVLKAKAAADSTYAQAEAQAKATRIQGDAEAEAIKAKGSALSQNAGLVALTQAERWDGKLPTTMVPGGAVPMLSIK